MTTTFFSPPGFGEIIPLNREEHRRAHPASVTAAFVSDLTAIPLTVPEFSQAAFHYPIAFVGAGNGEYQSVAITGLKQNVNTYVGKDGLWRAGCYVPAFVRAWPLCLAEVKESDGSIRGERLVCIAKDAIVSDGIELFDEAGKPTEFWKEREKFLKEYEDARTWTQDMCRLLHAHGVLKEFAVQADTGAGDKFVLKGMYRVDETLLGKLNSYQLRMMIKRGWLQAVYAHILSLRHFQDLLDEASPSTH